MDRYRSLGLAPRGDDHTYLNAFTYAALPRTGPGNTLQLGRHALRPGEDFYPLGYSANAQVLTRVARCKYGIQAPEKGRNDFDGVNLKDRAACMSISSPDGIHPHSEWLAWNDLRRRINDAVALGANAVIFYNDDPEKADDPSPEFRMKLQPSPVPVVFLTKSGFAKLGQDGDPVVLHTDVIREEMTGRNVVGYLGHGQPWTVVIGAHYDHLGPRRRGLALPRQGASESTTAPTTMPAVWRRCCNWRRDLVELDAGRTEANSYLFIAFSGEEKGLYGSSAWAKQPTLPIEQPELHDQPGHGGARGQRSNALGHQRRGYVTGLGGHHATDQGRQAGS
jgi:aminopeptidase YwaD